MDTYVESVGRIIGREVPDSMLVIVAEDEKKERSPVEAARRLRECDAYRLAVEAECRKRGCHPESMTGVIIDCFRDGDPHSLAVSKVISFRKGSSDEGETRDPLEAEMIRSIRESDSHARNSFILFDLGTMGLGLYFIISARESHAFGERIGVQVPMGSGLFLGGLLVVIGFICLLSRAR